MKWVKRWMRTRIRNLLNDDSEVQLRPTLSKASDVESEGLNIVVRNAIGGKIVTFRHYDNRTDRNSHKLYIIPDELDFERELGKMITLESMRMQ